MGVGDPSNGGLIPLYGLCASADAIITYFHPCLLQSNYVSQLYKLLYPSK